ncbi:MAG: hypothetical protein ACRDTQ_18315 [Micromonosporaceae bacterium]
MSAAALVLIVIALTAMLTPDSNEVSKRKSRPAAQDRTEPTEPVMPSRSPAQLSESPRESAPTTPAYDRTGSPRPAAPAAAPAAAPPPPPEPSKDNNSEPKPAEGCGAPKNPHGYNYCSGSFIEDPEPDTCDYFDCLDSFDDGQGYMVQCKDGMVSMSGGRPGACRTHGGAWRPVYQ